MNPPYLAPNLEELFDASPKEIRDMITGDEVNNATAILGKFYKIPISSYLVLSNLISYILIGGLQPGDVIHAFQDALKLSEEDATKLAKDLEKTILEKARIKILGKPSDEMVTLEFEKGRSPDELRKEILDTTNRESAFVKVQSQPTESVTPPTTIEPAEQPTSPGAPVEKIVPPQVKKPVVLTPGSRSQLMEQLQVLGSIPDDEEVEARLAHIREQIKSLDVTKTPENELTSSVLPQDFEFGEKGGVVVQAETQSATYSKAPTKYNVDPYREQADGTR